MNETKWGVEKSEWGGGWVADRSGALDSVLIHSSSSR